MWPARIHRFGVRQIKKRLMEIQFSWVKPVRLGIRGSKNSTCEGKPPPFGQHVQHSVGAQKCVSQGDTYRLFLPAAGQTPANVSCGEPQCFGPFFPLNRPDGRPKMKAPVVCRRRYAEKTAIASGRPEQPNPYPDRRDGSRVPPREAPGTDRQRPAARLCRLRPLPLGPAAQLPALPERIAAAGAVLDPGQA